MTWTPSLLTVAGLAVALLIAAYHLLPGEGEVREWRLYLLLGTVFPATLVGVGWLARRPGATWVGPFDAVFAGYGAAAALVLTARTWDWAAALVALFATAIARRVDRSEEGGAARTGLLFVTLLGVSHAAFQMPWWREGVAEQPSRTPGGLLLLAVLVAFAGATWWRPTSRPWSRPALGAALAVAAIPFALASLRLPDFASGNFSFHHWGVYVGPAGLVRDGGLLLWDVPAQYGTLSTWAIAAFPGLTVWESLRVLSAAAVFASALLVLGFFLAVRRDTRGLLLGFGLAFAAIFLFPNHTNVFVGPSPFPSTGAFRFGAAYLGLAVVAWEAGMARAEGSSSAARRAPLVAGALLWVASVAWSVEAAVYATATWIPAVAWSRFGLARRERSVPGALADAARALAWPLGILGLAVAGLVGWYRVAYGLTPDLSGYREYASSFTAAFGTLPIEMWSNGTMLFAVFLGLSTALAGAFADPRALDRQVVALASWGAVWSTASYFVARSHGNNVNVLIPVLVAAVVALWFGWSRGGARLGRDVGWAFSVWMAFLLFEGWHDPSRLRPVVAAFATDAPATAISRMPPPSPSLLALMTEAGVEPGERMLFLDWDLLPPVPEDPEMTARPWLPTVPVAGVWPLPVERRDVYGDRFRARRSLGGWYVRRLPEAFDHRPDLPALQTWIDHHYAASRIHENAEWRLEWREPKPRTRRARKGLFDRLPDPGGAPP